MAAAIALFLASSRTEEQADEQRYTTVKGMPSVGIYVKRTARSFLWDGTDPLQQGDRVQLSVSGEGFLRVTIFSSSGDPSDQKFERIYMGPLQPKGVTYLPTAWRIDGASDREDLLVVLSHEAVGENKIHKHLRNPNRNDRTDKLWMRQLVFRVQAPESAEQ